MHSKTPKPFKVLGITLLKFHARLAQGAPFIYFVVGLFFGVRGMFLKLLCISAHL